MSRRLPEGLLATIAFGIDSGIVVPNGHMFTLKGLASHKGPYNWFGRIKASRNLNPNWEYYVQVAEFVRLSRSFATSSYQLTFEDDFMDIGVYRDNQLLVCCEIKEKSTQARRLITGIKAYEGAIDYDSNDRGNDALRKAKYLVKHRPNFFYAVAIGIRSEFSLSYPHGKAFELQEDVIPFI